MGISRSEMQQVFWILDTNDILAKGGHKFSIFDVMKALEQDATEMLETEECIVRLQLDFNTQGPYTLLDKLIQKQDLGKNGAALGFVSDTDFRRAVIEVYDYLTSEQLERFLQVANKDSAGYIDFHEFFIRFDSLSIGNETKKHQAAHDRFKSPHEFKELDDSQKMGMCSPEFFSVMTRISSRMLEVSAGAEFEWLFKLFLRYDINSESMDFFLAARAIANLPLNVSFLEAYKLIACLAEDNNKNYNSNYVSSISLQALDIHFRTFIKEYLMRGDVKQMDEDVP